MRLWDIFFSFRYWPSAQFRLKLTRVSHAVCSFLSLLWEKIQNRCFSKKTLRTEASWRQPFWDNKHICGWIWQSLRWAKSNCAWKRRRTSRISEMAIRFGGENKHVIGTWSSRWILWFKYFSVLEAVVNTVRFISW